ncbi:MAG: inositol 2-dehydrogenase [Paracoccaceae bacterium]
MTLQFALVGAGRIGRVHARNISAISGAKLRAVADISMDAAARIATPLGADIRRIDEIVAAGDIDAVVISSPTNTHADLIEMCAGGGKAIFCEKPIDLEVSRVRTCLKNVADSGVALMVGFNRRFDPHFRAMKDMIERGKIGSVEMVNIISRDPEPPTMAYIKTSGGIFSDMTIHDFDMARFLLDEEIASVMASASNLIDDEIGTVGDFDSASIILTTAQGRQCTISNSRRATYGYDQRIEVLGDLGMVSSGNPRPLSTELATSDGFSHSALGGFFLERYEQAYSAEMRAFFRVVQGLNDPSPDGDDGLAALLLARAAMVSATTGTAVRP